MRNADDNRLDKNNDKTNCKKDLRYFNGDNYHVFK